MTDTSRIKGIVFDLDDTLYSQKEFKLSGFMAVDDWLHRNRGVPEGLSRRELLVILEKQGPSYGKMFNELVSALDLPESVIGELVEAFRRHKPAIRMFDGTREMLGLLRANFKVGVLTDGLESVQRNKAEALGLAQNVDDLLLSDSLGLVKPAPELFKWFEEKWELAGSQLTYVGDNPAKDFVGARKRGWLTVRVLTGEHAGVEPEPGYGADVTVADALEAAKLFKIGKRA